MVGPLSRLNTVPVGVPLAPNGSSGVGMLTTRPFIETGVLLVPGTLYRVDTPALLSKIQKGLPPLSEIPHGFTR